MLHLDIFVCVCVFSVQVFSVSIWVNVCEDICGATHPGFESDEFENHFHSEDSSEDHIENVHYIVKERRLAVVLQKRQEQLRKTDICK